MRILAIHAGMHDSSAAAFDDYRLVAAASEERFTRVKGQGGTVPWLAIDEVLHIAGLGAAVDRRVRSYSRGMGQRLAIATGKTRAGLNRALDSLGLAAQFDASRCADETEPKPHPRMLLELAEQLRIDPARMMMVGDTTHDLQMAQAAGAAAVAVMRSPGQRDMYPDWPNHAA